MNPQRPNAPNIGQSSGFVNGQQPAGLNDMHVHSPSYLNPQQLTGSHIPMNQQRSQSISLGSPAGYVPPNANQPINRRVSTAAMQNNKNFDRKLFL